MTTPGIEVRPADPADPAVDGLVRLHLAGMRASTPAEFAFALDASGLTAPDISLFGAWIAGEPAGIGALRQLGGGPEADDAGDRLDGEIKSMRTAPAHTRQGVAQAILDHLIATARERGYARVSLETGTAPEFEAAIALYERNGFVATGPFGDYAASDHNRFLTRELGRQARR